MSGSEVWAARRRTRKYLCTSPIYLILRVFCKLCTAVRGNTIGNCCRHFRDRPRHGDVCILLLKCNTRNFILCYYTAFPELNSKKICRIWKKSSDTKRRINSRNQQLEFSYISSSKIISIIY